MLGFALAPIYPLLIAETPARLGRDVTGHAVGFQVAAAYLGAAGLPGVAGVLARSFGLEAIGPFMIAVAVALLGLYEASLHLVRRPADRSPAAVADGATT